MLDSPTIYSPINRLVHPEGDLDWARELLDDRRIVQFANKCVRFFDEPLLFQYGGVTQNPGSTFFCGQEGAQIGGAAFSQPKALLKAAGEAAERYCLSSFIPEKAVFGAFREIAPNLDLNSFQYFSDVQLSESAFKHFRWSSDSKFWWIQGKDLTSGCDQALPAQLIYVPFSSGDEPGIFPSISTGGASGRSLEDAILRGIYEVIERDAYMIHYLHRLPSQHIVIDKDSFFLEIREYFEKFGLSIKFINLQTDLPAFCILVLIEDLRNTSVPSPWISAGMKCGPDIDFCLLGALEEAWHTRPWMRKMLQDLKVSRRSVQIGDPILDIPNRALFWANSELRHELRFLLEPAMGVHLSSLRTRSAGSLTLTLSEMIAELEKTGHKVYGADLTQPETMDYGIYTAKVLIPSLQQFHLIEPFLALNPRRFETFCNSLGFDASLFKQINKTPHFFL